MRTDPAGLRMKQPLPNRATRVPQRRRALLQYDNASVPCLIENVSSTGFLLACLDDLPVGQVLTLSSDLAPGKPIRCTIEVKHVADGSVGASVVEIDEASARWRNELMEEYYAAQLNRGIT